MPIFSWLKRYYLTIILLLAVFLLLFSLCLRLDPDLGWHLRVGQDLWKNHQIPRVDSYTFAFDGYSWRDHEWLAEAPLYLIFNYGGYSALVIIFSLLWFLPFWWHFRRFDFQLRAFLVLVAIYLASPFIGVRLQVLTLVGISLLIFLFERYRTSTSGGGSQGKKELIFLFPIIILLWANLHGSFVYGLLAGGVFLLASVFVSFLRRQESRQLYELKKITWILNQVQDDAKKHWQLIISFLISIPITLINPYGFGLWREIVEAANPAFKSMISEWQPIFNPPLYYALLAYYVFYALFWITNYHKKSKFPLYYYLLTIIFLILSMMSKRNVPIFILLSLPIFVERFSADEVVSKLQPSRWIKILAMLLLAVIFIIKSYPPFTTLIKNYDPFRTSWPKYPTQESIQYLKQLPEGTKVFASYDWGGYLIWAVPNIKVFMDGRGSYWKIDGKLAVAEYMSALSDFDKFKELQQKYRFDYVLTGSLSDGFNYDYLAQKDIGNYTWNDLQEVLLKSGVEKVASGPTSNIFKLNQ